MKTLLLIGTLAFSLNLFGQTFPGVVDYKSPALNSIKNNKIDLLKTSPKNSSKFSKKQPGIPIKNNAVTHRGLNPVYDSIYFWNWIEGATDWSPEVRIRDIAYSASDLPLSYNGQQWVGHWENSFRYEITYDVNDNIINELEKEWNGIGWVDVYQKISTYDGNNNLASETQQVWENGAWHSYDRYVNTYDANSNLLTELYQVWNVVDWENSDIYTYTYDQNNNLLSQINQYWNGISWENGAHISFSYDSENNQLGGLGLQWDNGGWVNSFQITNLFHSNNTKESELFEIWNGAVWENSSYTLYWYDGDNRLSNQQMQTWTGNQWENQQLLRFEYDNFDNITLLEFQIWNGQSWLVVNRNTSEYNDDNYLISEATKYFDSTGVNLLFGDSTHYYLRTTVAVNEINDEFDAISIYPNPNNGVFTISSEDAIGDIEIFSSLGEKIYRSTTLVQQKKHEIKLTEAGSGIYFILLHEGENYWSKKIVVGKK